MTKDPVSNFDLDEGPGPALPIDDRTADAMIASALAPARPQRRLLPFVAAIAATLIAPGAIAAWYVAQKIALAPKPAQVRTKSPRPKEPIEQPKPVVEGPVEAPVAGPIDVPEIVAPPKAPRVRKRPVRKRRVEPRAKPEDLLSKANALRRERAWAKAKTAYSGVIERYPNSSAAYVARVAAASIALEHLGDPQGALSLLNAARTQRPAGPLDAEILWAQSRAFRRTKQAAKERAVLKTLLKAHPEAPLAAPAKQRLDVLGAP